MAPFFMVRQEFIVLFSSKPLLSLINHILLQSPWSCERLAPFSQHTVEFRLGKWALCFRISATGLLDPMPDSLSPANYLPDVAVTLPGNLLQLATTGFDAAMKQAQITGKVELAETLAFLAKNLRWDVTDDLARFVGDVPAHRMVSTGQHVLSHAKGLFVQIKEQWQDHLRHDATLVPTSAEVTRHTHDLQQLRNDIARLEKRVGQL